MKQLALSILVCLLWNAPVLAGPEQGRKPDGVCEKQHAQCMKQCDKEKRAWFFKGEAYDNCAEKCTARHDACKAEKADVDPFEVIPPRGKTPPKKQDTDEPPVSMDEAEEEDLEAVEGEGDGPARDRGKRGAEDREAQDRKGREDDGR